MLAEQRQMLIVEEIRRRGAVRVSELTERFAVSDMTIRRDLDLLAASGLLAKVHGGATAVGRPSTDEPGFEANSRRQIREKEAIAQAAAKLVEPGQAIGLTAGTTTWRLAHHLLGAANLTIVTNSIEVANVFHRERRTDLTVVLTGGVRTPSDALVGPVALTTIRALHLDLLFIGVHGIAEDPGLTSPNLLEADTDQAFVSSSSRIVVVADHTKWGVRGLSRIAPLDAAHALVTDDGLAADARTILGEHIDQVIVAPVQRRGRRSALEQAAGS